MKEWGSLIAAVLAICYIIYAIEKVGAILGKRLDELHDKVDVLQEKLDEIEANQD